MGDTLEIALVGDVMPSVFQVLSLTAIPTGTEIWALVRNADVVLVTKDI